MCANVYKTFNEDTLCLQMFVGKNDNEHWIPFTFAKDHGVQSLVLCPKFIGMVSGCFTLMILR
jgi:hypothetical protein